MATQSLFGGSLSPQEMQAQMLEQKAAQFAQMSPDQQLGMMAYKAGSNVGTGLAGAFGVQTQDPMIQRATKLRELAGQYNTNTAAGIRQMADALRTQDPEMALQLSQKAAAMDLEAAKLTSEQALAKQRGKEEKANDPFQKLVESGKYTPASLADYQKSGKPSDLVLYEKPEKEAKIAFGSDAERISKQLFGTDFNKLTPEQAGRVNKEVLNQEALLKATGASKQTVINSQETAFAKQRGELQAKSLSEAETQAKASANAVNRLAGMEKLNQGTMITGPLANTGIGAGQFLSSLGLLSPDSAKTLASSEVYDKLAKDLVMQDLGGKLGAQISNADRDFIEARIPQLRNSQQARTELIGKLKEIHKKNIDYYQRMSKHANTKGSLNDFDFASSAPDTGPALGTKENPIKLK